ncbi:MAG: sterol desaturase family protein, partial [Proteobacteria bacterium]|nr:sterol desaturase family protein [Pseudomonadota bacterium]
MENEVTIRLVVFLGLFSLLALIEVLLPRRKRDIKRPARWFTNIGLIIIDSFTIRLMAFVLPVMAVTAAADASAQGWGLLGMVNWPNWVEVVIAMLVLDFVIWAQH